MTKSNSALLSTLILLTVSLAACGEAGSTKGTTSRFGQFGSSPCFLNKLASQGMGTNIYTIASMQFNANGTGTTSFRLFDDAGCTNELGSGTADTRYEFQTSEGGTILIQIDQYEPSDPSIVTRFWIPAFASDEGFYMDIDYADGESGPYLSVPNSAEIAEFVASPKTEGLLLTRE